MPKTMMEEQADAVDNPDLPAVPSFSARQVQEISAALEDLATNRMPLRLTAQVRRMKAAFDEYNEPLTERLQEEFAKHSNGQESVAMNSPEGILFAAAVEDLLQEQLEVEFVGVAMTDLEALSEVQMTPRALDILVRAGVVID